MRSTKIAPLSLSTSYLTGSASLGISMMTLISSGGFLPVGTRSRPIGYCSVGISGGKERILRVRRIPCRQRRDRGRLRAQLRHRGGLPAFAAAQRTDQEQAGHGPAARIQRLALRRAGEAEPGGVGSRESLREQSREQRGVAHVAVPPGGHQHRGEAACSG